MPASSTTSEMSNDWSWLEDLPQFQGLFENRVSSILPSFVRLAIPFFRRSSASPTGSVSQIIDLTDVEDQDGLDLTKAEKAFLSYQTYIAHAKSTLAKADSDIDSPEAEGLKEYLSEGYIRGFYIACLARGSEGNDVDYLQVARDCLEGLRILSPHLSPTAIQSLERNLVGAIFADPSLSPRHFLAVLFTQTRALNTRLQTHHLQRPTQKGSASVTPLVDPVKSNEEEVIALLGLLEDFFLLALSFERLPGRAVEGSKQTKKAIKERDEQDQSRPGRIAMEALIARCELSMALASLDMSNIKKRAIKCHTIPTSDEKYDVGSDAESDVQESSDAEEDVKPDLQPVGTPEGDGSDEAKTVVGANSEEHKSSAIEWEDQAERCLLQCLRNAAYLLKSRHPKTLREIVRPTDWLDDLPHQSGHSHRHGDVFDAHSDDETDSGDDSETTDSESETPDNGEATGAARPAPLRAIFRLQDRYEELRLAVWLSLPTESRGKMSAFMRGIPTPAQEQAMREAGVSQEETAERRTGQVGRAWDELGLLLLKDFNSVILSDLGLDLEKLDKWQDLAAAVGSRKAKKGRKTI